MPRAHRQEPYATRSLEEYEITVGADTLFLPLYTSQPIHASDASITRAIVIIHGQSRNADDYFDYVAEAVQGVAGIFVAAPQFAIIDDGPASGQLYWTSNWSQMDRSRVEAGPFRVSSGTVLDDIIATIRSSFPNATEVVIAGFSAGGQLVTRYAATNTEGDNVYLVGGPSSYLYMSATRYGPAFAGSNDYKYGLDNLNVTAYVNAVGAVALASNFQTARVTTLVGTLDNNPADASLDTSGEALAQGANRLERMNYYSDHLLAVYGASIYDTHTFGTVAGAAHNGRTVLNSVAAKAILRGS